MEVDNHIHTGVVSQQHNVARTRFEPIDLPGTERERLVALMVDVVVYESNGKLQSIARTNIVDYMV